MTVPSTANTRVARATQSQPTLDFSFSRSGQSRARCPQPCTSRHASALQPLGSRPACHFRCRRGVQAFSTPRTALVEAVGESSSLLFRRRQLWEVFCLRRAFWNPGSTTDRKQQPGRHPPHPPLGFACFLLPSLLLSGVTSQSNYPPLSLCLRLCFGGKPDQDFQDRPPPLPNKRVSLKHLPSLESSKQTQAKAALS